MKFLERSELEQFIIHSCQVAGEILLSNGENNKEVSESNTCIPLRMAGLDMALTWSDDNYDDITNSMKGEVEMRPDMIQLIFENAAKGPGTLRWKPSGGNRRRLEEIYDDDYHGDYDEYDYDDYGYEDEEEDKYDPPARGNNNNKSEVQGNEKEFMDGIASSPFSRTRNAFTARSALVLEEISKILDAPPVDDADEEAEAEAEADESKEEDAASEESNIDPAAYSMTRNELRRKEAAIQKGLRWAASAKLLFTFSNQSDDNLRRLAIGTLYYGRVNTVQVWQILQSILPEYKDSTTEESETCGSPWASSCPPKTISRNGVDYPPSFVLEAATAFCDEEAALSSSNSEMQELCASEGSDSSTVAIPTSMPDGYYGYTVPVPRSPEDPLSTLLFAPLDNLTVDTAELESLEKKKRETENEKRNLERNISDTWKDIGGKEGENQMGENGELHALADKCFDILAGKYTYEVCLFGRASQKEGAGSGTSLGNWKGMEKDPETGTRVMMWTDGQGCWNGPKRSATVYVTCGSETKLISADEPDTCRYVFEMESHIGCDDDYKSRVGL